MHRHTISFAVISAVLLMLAGTALSYLYRTHAQHEVEAMAERNNVALARVFANTMLSDAMGYVAASETLSAAEMQRRSEVEALKDRMAQLIKGSSVAEVTIYDLRSRVVYSTDEDEIGETKPHNAGLDSARARRVASATVWKDHLDTLEGAISDRNVVESYIPLYDPAAPEQVAAIFEIYDDVTDILREIEQNHRRIMIIVGGVMSALYLGLVVIVVRGARRIAQQHAKNLRLSAAVARSEAANQAKTEFLANMSHELRTPLNAIIGFSEMIKREALGPVGVPRYAEYATHIHSSGTHLLAIVNNLFDIVNAETGTMVLQRERVAIAEIIQQSERTIRERAAAAGIAVEVELDEQLEPIVSDEARLRQIVLNLLSNAVKFTPRGGLLKVAARREHETVVVEIADTGIGISPEDLPNAMAPFGQVDSSLARTHQGTGLGLPLAKRMTELLGGTFRIDSTVGAGTRIRITFPLSRPVAAARAEAA
jgi:two-component system, cell cycle sensor histidine kinase PleC